ncbi:nucleotide cyclase [Cladochytrium replicatum]|nr:nucleotide cyclase [Cladochytrium replicatum]
MDIHTKMGVETGPLVAGIVGTNKFVYDIYGDTVNTSSRCLTAATEGQIVTTRNMADMLDSVVSFESLGVRHLKGKGDMELFNIIELKADVTGSFTDPNFSQVASTYSLPAKKGDLDRKRPLTLLRSVENPSKPKLRIPPIKRALTRSYESIQAKRTSNEMSFRDASPSVAAKFPTSQADLIQQFIRRTQRPNTVTPDPVSLPNLKIISGSNISNPNNMHRLALENWSLSFFEVGLEKDYLNYHVWRSHKAFMTHIGTAIVYGFGLWILVEVDTHACCTFSNFFQQQNTDPSTKLAGNCNTNTCLEYPPGYLPISEIVSPYVINRAGMLLFFVNLSVLAASWYLGLQEIRRNTTMGDRGTISELIATLVNPKNNFLCQYRVRLRYILYVICYCATSAYQEVAIIGRRFDRYRSFTIPLLILRSAWGLNAPGIPFQKMVIWSSIMHICGLCTLFGLFRARDFRTNPAVPILEISQSISGHILVVFTCWLRKKTVRMDFVTEIVSDRQRVMTENEGNRSQNLLVALFPLWVARWLENNPPDVPYPIESFDSVTLMYCDIVKFTDLCSSQEPVHVITLLNKLFCGFDFICRDLHIEKITTIGDAYFACGGLVGDSLPSNRTDNHGVTVCRAALQMDKLIFRLNESTFVKETIGRRVSIRTGIHTGPVQGTVIGGAKKFRYDIIGPAVSTCEEVQTRSVDGRITITGTTYQLVCGEFEFLLTPRPELRIEGTACYFLDPSNNFGSPYATMHRSSFFSPATILPSSP